MINFKDILKITSLFSLVPFMYGCLPLPNITPGGGTIDPIEAVKQTAAKNQACKIIGDFYWSIGDATNQLGSGQVGTTYSATTRMPLYSASKLIFSTYTAQKVSGSLNQSLIRGLNFTSGYVGPSDKICLPTDTVGLCFDRDQSLFDAAKVGQFNYASGHMQKIAAQDLNLYSLTRQSFAAEIMSVLGSNLDLTFDVNFFGQQAGPVAAGGMNTTPAAYESFLKKLASGQYFMSSLLGTQSVATGAPNLRYSLGHWVESDGTFSSVGALGFYPWIDSTKQYWGVVAKVESNPTKVANASTQSMACGQKLRKAFLTKTVQLN